VEYAPQSGRVTADALRLSANDWQLAGAVEAEQVFADVVRATQTGSLKANQFELSLNGVSSESQWRHDGGKTQIRGDFRLKVNADKPYPRYSSLFSNEKGLFQVDGKAEWWGLSRWSNANGTFSAGSMQGDVNDTDNRHGNWNVAQSLLWVTQRFDNRGGEVQADKVEASLHTLNNAWDTQPGTIAGRSISFTWLDNSPYALVRPPLKLDNTQGQILAQEDLQLRAHPPYAPNKNDNIIQWNNILGRLEAGTTLTLDTDRAWQSQLDNTDGSISANDRLFVQVKEGINLRGRVFSQNRVEGVSRSWDNTAGQLQGDSVQWRTQQLVNQEATGVGPHLPGILGRSVTLQFDPYWTSAKSDPIGASLARLNNAGGMIYGKESLAIHLVPGLPVSLDFSGEYLHYKNHFLTVNNTAGLIASEGQLGIHLGHDYLQVGQLSGLNGELMNHQGQVRSSGKMTLEGAKIDNHEGHLLAQDGLTVQAQTFDRGTITTPLLDVTTHQWLSQPKSTLQVHDLSISLHPLEQGFRWRNEGWLSGKPIPGKFVQDTSPLVITGSFTLKPWERAQGKRSFDATFLSDISAQGSIHIQTEGNIALHGTMSSSQLDINSPVVTINKGAFRDVKALTLTADEIVNTQGLIEAESLTIHAKTLNNDGSKLSGKQVALHVPALSNVDGVIHGAKTLKAEADILNNTRGQIQGQQIEMVAQSIDTTLGKVSGETTTIRAKDLNNTQGEILGKNALTLDAQTVDNTQGTLSGHQVVATAKTKFDNSAGRVSADGPLRLLTSELNNTQGNITSAEQGVITATRLVNDNGTLQATKQLTIQAEKLNDPSATLVNHHGLIDAPMLHVSLPTVTNPGGRIYGTDVTLATHQLLNQPGSPGGFIGAREQLFIAVDTLTNTDGARFYSGGDITLGGVIGPEGQVIGEASTLRNVGGTFDAQGTLVINARSIENIEGGALLAGHTVLWPSGSFTNDANVVSGTFSVNTEGSFHNTGRIEATHIDVHANQIHNAGKLLLTHERLNLRGLGQNSTLDNQGGVVFSYGDVVIDVGRLLTKEGSLLAGKNALLRVGSIEGEGRFLAGQQLRFDATTPLALGQASLFDAAHTWIGAPAVRNAGRVYGDRVTVATQQLTQQGVIAARDRLDLGVGMLTQEPQSVLFSAGAMAIGGAVTAAGEAVGEATAIENRGGLIESLADGYIRTATIRNTNARLDTHDAPVGEPKHDFWIVPKDSTERVGRDRLMWSDHLAEGTGGYWILRELPPRPIPYAALRDWVMMQSNPALLLPHGDVRAAIRLAERTNSPPYKALKTLASALGYEARYPELFTSSSQNIFPVAQTYQPLIQAARERLYWQQLATQGGWSATEVSDPEYARLWRGLLAKDSPSFGWGWPLLTTTSPAFVDALPLTEAQHPAVYSYNEVARQAAVGQTGHWTEFETQTQRVETRVTHSEPGVIRVGGDLTLHASERAENENSLIVVGKHLGITGQSWSNTGVSAGRWAEATGRMRSSHHKHEGGITGRGNWRETSSWVPFEAESSHETFPLLISRVDQNTPLTNVAYDMPPRVRELAAASALSVEPVQIGQPQPLSNALFQPSSEASDRWFDTDPAFMAGDTRPGLPALLGRFSAGGLPRRLGDSVYEQWMVRDQIRLLTGARFLPGYTQDTAMYEGLLANALALGSSWPVGQPLSDDVVRTLDRSVVWPVVQTVPGPQGRAVEAVVPQVYLHRPPVNRLPAAVSARTIAIDVTGRYQASSTTHAHETLTVHAPQIEEAGHVQGTTLAYQGDQVTMTGQLHATEAITAQATQSLEISSQTVSTERAGSTYQGLSQRATLDAGGAVTLNSGGDMTLTAAQIAGDQVALTAAGQVELGAAATSSSLSLDGGDTQWKERLWSTVGTRLHGTHGITIGANAITGTAPQLTSPNGELHLQGTEGITFQSGEHGKEAYHAVTQRHDGMFSSSDSHSTATATHSQGIGTVLTGDRITLRSEAGAIQAEGLTVLAHHDLTVTAQHGMTFTPVHDTLETTLTTRESCEGIGCGSGAAVYGKASSWNTGTQGSAYDATTTLTSATGKVTLISEHGAIDLTATDIDAATDMTVKGTHISWKPGHESAWQTGHSEASASGIQIGVGGTGALGSAQQLVNQLNAAQHSADPASQRLYHLAGARSGYDMAHAFLQGAAGTGGRFSLGYNDQCSVSDFSWKTEGTQAQTAQAGGTITLHATQGDIYVKDATLTAQAMDVETPGRLIIDSGETKSESHFTSHSDQRTVGPGLTAGASAGGIGLGVDVGLSGQRSDGSGRTVSTTYRPSEWRVTGKFEGIARDVELLGSTVTAERLELEVERYLKVISQSNRFHQTQEQTQDSLTAQVPVYGVGGMASVSHQTQSAQGTHEGVGTPAALHAGVDGLSLKAGHTELMGGILQSEAGSDKNRLETGTLTARDLAGHYTATVSSESVGMTVTTPGFLPAGQTPALPYAGLALGMSQTTDVSQDWKTSSAVGSTIPITITDAAAHAQLTGQTPAETVAALNRAIPSEASPAITPLDLNAELSAQQSRLGAWSAAGQAVAMTVGDITGYQQQEARKAGDEALAQRWSEGGDLKVLTQAIAAGLLAHVGRADIAGAMAGAAVSQLLAKPTAELGHALGGDQQVIGQLVTNLASSAVGYGAGGQAGAVMASTFDLYNRQLHPQELQRIKELAQGNAEKELRLTAAGCALVHCSAQLEDKHPDYKAWQSLEKAGNDPALAAERRVLLEQKDLFVYDKWDGIKDWADREKVGTRALGAIQWVGGNAQAVLAGAACAAGGVGCGAAPYLAATGYDTAQAGWKTLKSGESHATQGSLVLQSLGLSPEAAELLYGATQLAPVAVEAYLTGRAINQVGAKVQGTVAGNAAKIETQLAGKGAHIVPGTGHRAYSMSDAEVRVWYHEQLDAIPSRIDSSLSSEKQALQAFILRNEIKQQARELMSNRALAEELAQNRPLKKLPDIAKRAYEENLVGDDFWKYMKDGSIRSNKKVDEALGLKRDKDGRAP
jgi:filamentous hemagglutinin